LPQGERHLLERGLAGDLGLGAEQRLEAGAELLPALARDLGIELGSPQALRPQGGDLLARGVQLVAQRPRGVEGRYAETEPRAPGLVPLRPDLLGCRAALSAERGGQRLEVVADRLRAPDRRLLRQLFPSTSPVEEPIARRAEALPQRVGLVPGGRSAALPFRLELLDGGRRLLPLGRVGERLDLLAERLLPLRAVAPSLVQAIEVLLPAREEAIAGLPKFPPERRRVSARNRTNLLPGRLESPDLRRGLVPARGVGQRGDLGAERALPLEVARQVRVAAPARLVACRPEAFPGGLRPVGGRGAPLGPLSLEPPELRDALGEVVRFEKRFDAGVDLLLGAGVCPSPPLLGLLRLRDPPQELFSPLA